MMLKIRILHKGLILVAVPLIFGIGFISLLFSGLLESSKLLDREFLLKDAMVSHLSTMTAGYCGMAGKQMYMATQNPSWKKYYLSKQKTAVAEDKHLRKLLKNERSLKIPPLNETYNTIVRRHIAMTPLLKNLQVMSREQSKASMKSLESLRFILYTGVSAGILTSILLAIFFCLNITNRLLVIVNNALSLSRGTALNTPFKGNDEIAELDQLLYKSASEIRELERFKKEMIGVVSHELKSPLSSVASFLSNFGAGIYGELTEKAKDKVNRTYTSVKRLMGLVAELLYLDRLELEMSPVRIEVDKLLAEAVDTVRELSEKSGIEVKLKSSGGDLFADRNRLVQVIVNLLSNALKFSPPNGSVSLEAQLKDGFFECRISDQGKGIPESFRKNIFEPFKQVDAADRTSKKGTGLGLAISRSIVEQHGGEIGVDSELGQGSTFWFKLPQGRNAGQNSLTAGSDRSNGLALKTVENIAPENLKAGKFRILHQGLLIIALPLVFQIGVALVFNNMLNGLLKQIEQEEQSIKVQNSLNRATDCIAAALEKVQVEVYLPISSYSHAWEKEEKRACEFLDIAIGHAKGHADQIKDLTNAKQILKQISAMIAHEAQTHESKNAFDKLDFSYRKFVYNMYGLHLEPRTPEEFTEDKIGAQPSAITLWETAKSLMNDPVHTNSVKFLKLETYLERGMNRERLLSQQAGRQRARMIDSLKMTLIASIIVSVAISILIAFFLMRSISRRLRHIMQNTERLAKRDILQPALAGHDEIALLDRVLFETGNRLMELELFKRELVSIVSHELRTPLLSISAALEVFGTGIYGDFSEKGKNRLKYAQEESDRLVRLINDLLDIEKMEAGKFILDLSELNVAELIDNAKSGAAELAEAKQIKIDTSKVDSNLTITADRDRLSQVFINLLSNAIKYSPENGTITVSAQEINEKKVKFSISDQGRGIPEQLKQKIFDRFVQVESSDATERGGTGLGLAISQAIVEQHGGEIGVDSEMGSGSSFWFIVPVNSKNLASSD